MKKELAAGLALIFIDVLNIAEQFGIYFIAKESSLDESAQQRFFFILFGVGGATLIRPMCLWSKLKVIFSILIEVGELVSYLCLLPYTTNLITVASVFFALEVLLHIVYLFTVKSNFEEIDGAICARDYCCFPFRVLFYGLIYSSPILFLFLDPNSSFRDTYYENLLILNVFFGVNYIDLVFDSCRTTESEPEVDEVIYKAWQVLIYVGNFILTIIVTITTLVFSGQAIHKNATGEQSLAQYDYGVYIYSMVISSIWLYSQWGSCCSGLSKKMGGK